MNSEILTRANIKVRTLYSQYCRIADEETALIMACAEGGQSELVQPLLELKKQDQTILMEETFQYLVPREELYPLGGFPRETYPLEALAGEEDAQEKNKIHK